MPSSIIFNIQERFRSSRDLLLACHYNILRDFILSSCSVGPASIIPAEAEQTTLICFSHLRWDFVFQRPQHLMTRFAHDYRVIYWEEPQHSADVCAPRLQTAICGRSGVTVATPVLPDGMSSEEAECALTDLLAAMLAKRRGPLVRWYYTPMMLGFSRHLDADCTVYDCMDELANFRFAPPELADRERELMARANLVFTGGYSLYEAKRSRHPSIHPFPSSVDRTHFGAARTTLTEPADQAYIPTPRLGFYGVVDERMDLGLLAGIADARPDWNLVIVGPVAKVDPVDLPARANIHYLGAKTYDELPAYLAGWDVALMPFAINDSTRFISPTKTPEYLAGGRPVVSTAIQDVRRHYGHLQAVAIADTTETFIAACDAALALPARGGWRDEADAVLSSLSWDETFERMEAMVDGATRSNRTPSSPRAAAMVSPTTTGARSHRPLEISPSARPEHSSSGLDSTLTATEIQHVRT